MFSRRDPRMNRGRVPARTGRLNLLASPSAFDAAIWVKTRSSITPDAAVDPFGTTQADALIEDGTAGATHAISQTITPALAPVATSARIYFKAAGRTQIELLGNGTAIKVKYDSVAITATTAAGSPLSKAITSVGSGWFLCEMSWTCDGTSSLQLRLLDGTGAESYNGDGTSGVYLYGAAVYQ